MRNSLHHHAKLFADGSHLNRSSTVNSRKYGPIPAENHAAAAGQPLLIECPAGASDLNDELVRLTDSQSDALGDRDNVINSRPDAFRFPPAAQAYRRLCGFPMTAQPVSASR